MTTLAALTAVCLRRLGDEDETVWTEAEILDLLRQGYRELALQTKAFWDQTCFDHRPRGFSLTSACEAEYADFDYGTANCTSADETHLLDESRRTDPAGYTCPDEWAYGWLTDCGAVHVPDGKETLPDDVIAIERGTWSGGTIQGLTPREARSIDPRYEITKGPVYGFLWQQDGSHTLRCLRVPSASATAYTLTGAWGIARTPTDLSTATVSGSWGIPRCLPGHHPCGGEQWGTPRQPFTTTATTVIEHWREGRLTGSGGDTVELPDLEAGYLRDFALARCLERSGPGQDLKLAQWYGQRWIRDLGRLKARIVRVDRERVAQFGGSHRPLGTMPPRPQRPPNYPADTR